MTRRFPPPVPGLPSERQRYRTILQTLSDHPEQPTVDEFVSVCRDAIVAAEPETDSLSKSWTKHILNDLERSGFVREESNGDGETDTLRVEIDSQQWLDGEIGFSECIFRSLKRGWVLRANHPEGFEALEQILHALEYELNPPSSSREIKSTLEDAYDYQFSEQGIRGYHTLLLLMGWIEKRDNGYIIPSNIEIENKLQRIRNADVFKQYENRLRREGAMVEPPPPVAKRALSKYYMYRESGGWSKQKKWYRRFQRHYLKPSAREATSAEPTMERKDEYPEIENRRSELRAKIKNRFDLDAGLGSFSVSALERIADAEDQREAHQILVQQGNSLSQSELQALVSEGRRYEFDPEFELYDWQQEAADRWFEGTEQTAPHTGIAEVVTGAGKTVMALEVIRRWVEQTDDGVVTVVVPTRVLMYQWLSELTEKLNVPIDDIGWAGDGNRDQFEVDGTRVVVAIVNTAVKDDFLASSLESVGNPPHLLIADECHNYTGDVHSNVLKYHNTASLGLSATPTEKPQGERDASESEQLLFEKLGDIYYTLTYSEAIDGLLIPRFKIKYVGFDLTQKEQQEYDHLSRKISDALSDIRARHSNRLHELNGNLYQKLNTIQSSDGSPAPAIGQFFTLTQERRDLVNNAICRQAISLELLKQVNSDEKAIVFQERIRQLEQLVAPSEDRGINREREVAQEKDYNYRSQRYDLYPKLKQIDEKMERLFAEPDFWPVMYHSGHSRDLWNDLAMEWFRADDHANVMYSVKALIEGVDVPDADTGIVRVSSGSVRQRIQTLGRILRTGSNPDHVSELYVLYARNTVDENIFREYDWNKQLGSAELSHYVWNTDDGPLDGSIEPTDEPLPDKDKYEEPEYPDASELEPGDPYSGPVQGYKISVDSEGNPFEKSQEGRKFIDNAEIEEAAEIVHRRKGGGTIYITEPGHMVTKLPDGAIFLGETDGPDSFEYQETNEGSLSEDPPDLEDLLNE